MTVPTNAQLLETTALPMALVVQPFAQLRYDEAPIPLVSSWNSGQSAFDRPPNPQEDEGPIRCEKCRGYVNPWVKFTDGGQRWLCNLCNTSNSGQSSALLLQHRLPVLTMTVPASYYSHLAVTGQRVDHHERPELLHGTVDFAVPRAYWSPQPTASALDAAEDGSAANLAAASDALQSTATDLLGGLQSSLGQTPASTRGPSPAPGYREREKERKKEEKRLRKPRPLGRVFVIDVSGPSVQRGVVREVCEGIRRALYGSKRKTENGHEGDRDGNGDAETEEPEEDVIGADERIAIVTVAETIGFWNLSVSRLASLFLVGYGAQTT